MLSNGVVRWFEIYVQDVDRARRFYEGVFGYSLSLLQAGDIEMWTFGHESAAMGTTTGAIVRAKVVFLALAEPLCISVAMIAQLKSRVYQLLGVEYIDRKWLSVSMALSHWSLIPRKT